MPGVLADASARCPLERQGAPYSADLRSDNGRVPDHLKQPRRRFSHLGHRRTCQFLFIGNPFSARRESQRRSEEAPAHTCPAARLLRHDFGLWLCLLESAQPRMTQPTKGLMLERKCSKWRDRWLGTSSLWHRSAPCRIRAISNFHGTILARATA